MKDPFGRTIDYLRISVTDRCNFRCVYCMPEEGFPVAPKDHLLTYEEIGRLVRIFARLGTRKIRLTGGEPLVRKDLARLVRAVAESPEIRDLSLTTNAYLLDLHAQELADAGLTRVNVSLDTLRPDRFREIAAPGDFERTMKGIRAAQEAGLHPLKVNCVAMRGVNDEEFVDFARWTLEEEVHVRFIELMPIRWNMDEFDGFDAMQPHGDPSLIRLNQTDGGMLSDLQMRRMMISAAEIADRIELEMGPLEPHEIPTNGPARTFRVPGAKGTVGFISQISHDLCSRCNRLRLTADGYLRPCLMSDGELLLRDPMRAGASDEDLERLILHVVAHKPERHYLAEGQKVVGRGMSQIGG
jgi:GTP 3',8-cyclase